MSNFNETINKHPSSVAVQFTETDVIITPTKKRRLVSNPAPLERKLV